MSLCFYASFFPSVPLCALAAPSLSPAYPPLPIHVCFSLSRLALCLSLFLSITLACCLSFASCVSLAVFLPLSICLYFSLSCSPVFSQVLTLGIDQSLPAGRLWTSHCCKRILEGQKSHSRGSSKPRHASYICAARASKGSCCITVRFGKRCVCTVGRWGMLQKTAKNDATDVISARLRAIPMPLLVGRRPSDRPKTVIR